MFTGLTIAESQKEITARFIESGSSSPAIDAAVLLCHVLDKPRSYLLTWPERALTESQAKQLATLVTRREQGEPVAYIVGEREFWSMPLNVSPTTLIPRPDTERLVELALDKAQLAEGPILDLGTGTGAIALAIASELPDRQVLGVDYQQDAVELATGNSEKLDIRNATFAQGSWFEPIDSSKQFAIIVSNPPYIDEQDPHLQQGDVVFEPSTALIAKDNGLADIKHIANEARQFLQTQGWLLFEHGFEQGSAVRDILLKNGYQQVSTEQDYAGNDRVTLGRWN
jgi:release factor glutamine methyltransferase